MQCAAQAVPPEGEKVFLTDLLYLRKKVFETPPPFDPKKATPAQWREWNASLTPTQKQARRAFWIAETGFRFANSGRALEGEKYQWARSAPVSELIGRSFDAGMARAAVIKVLLAVWVKRAKSGPLPPAPGSEPGRASGDGSPRA